MADRTREFENLVAQLNKLRAPQVRSFRAGARIDICAIWASVKPIVELTIKILRLLPFAWAKKAADALEVLRNALNAICK